MSLGHLKILWEVTITTLPKLSSMLWAELPPAPSALQVFCVSCLYVAHTPKYQLCFCWRGTAGKRPKSGYITEHLRGRSVVSMGVWAAHL